MKRPAVRRPLVVLRCATTQMLTWNAATAVTRIGLGAVLLWSSILKIRYPHSFLSAIYGYELVGPRTALFVAVTLPWLELIIAICLLARIGLKGSMFLAFLLAAIFTIAIGSALYRGLRPTCGCFGASNQTPLSFAVLVRSITMLVCSVVGLLA